MGAASAGLLAVGYPVSLAVICRFFPVVRERRLRWLLAHHAAVLAIVAGWAMRGNRPAAAVNSAWLVVASAVYLAGRREKEEPRKS